jgi:flagellar biosynthetic protein FliP
MAQLKSRGTSQNLAWYELSLAYLLSELRIAFTIGFLLFLPFVAIDLLTSAFLATLGMGMLPPALISLPLKLLLFILVDGWHLIAKELAQSFSLGGL